jgi:hypothetical protein
MDEQIRISASCLAEYATSRGRSVESLLRPFKFKERGEGFARSSYYQPAVSAIRLYHSRGNDLAVFHDARIGLRQRAEKAAKRLERVRCERNIDAIIAYSHIYRDRKFTVLPNKRIEYRLDRVLITTQPDLWVQEGSSQVLLKIGVARKNRTYIDALLTITRKAAISSGHRIRARNFVYLDVKTARELTCAASLKTFNRQFMSKAQEIASAWARIEEETGPRGGEDIKPAA